MSHRIDDEPALRTADGGLVRVRLDLAYDGTDFRGFARQPGLRTVQGVLEQTLAMVLRLPGPVATTCAGRTDAGVHALGQVVHTDLPAEVVAAVPAEDLVRRLAGALPRDLRVPAVSVAPAGFDARFAALRRHYRYRVCDDPAGPDPLRRHDTLWHPRPLDVARLSAAAAALVGEHDFAAFCRYREGASTIRELQHFSWERLPDERGVFEASLVADAFCHSMVRSMVGACLAVGEGRRPVDWVVDVLAEGVRVSDVQVVAPVGLVLVGVDYPPDAELAARVARTRRPRTGPGAEPAPL